MKRIRGPLPPALRGHFETFWATYPTRRPNPRALAENAFAWEVAAGAAPEDLIRAAAAYAAECKARGIAQDFIVHARTFIAQRRWQDYLDATSAAPAAAGFEHPLWSALQSHMPASDFRAWILPLEVAHRCEDGSLALVAPSRFHARHVETQYGDLIRRAAAAPALEIWP